MTCVSKSTQNAAALADHLKSVAPQGKCKKRASYKPKPWHNWTALEKEEAACSTCLAAFYHANCFGVMSVRHTVLCRGGEQSLLSRATSTPLDVHLFWKTMKMMHLCSLFQLFVGKVGQWGSIRHGARANQQLILQPLQCELPQQLDDS